ncbi:uncharacterized protein [Rutidosis leptorrhynchoides]
MVNKVSSLLSDLLERRNKSHQPLSKIEVHILCLLLECCTKVTSAAALMQIKRKDLIEEGLRQYCDEMVSMNEMAEIVLSFEDKKLPIHHIPGPEGVRGRNSDNTLIKEKLGWASTMWLKDGLRITYFWIKEQIEKEAMVLIFLSTGRLRLLGLKHRSNYDLKGR